MTSTLTVLNPNGIIMATDSRISQVDSSTGMVLRQIDNIKKIYRISKANVGISYWGLAEIQETPMLDFMAEFEESSINVNDTVDNVASALRTRLQSIHPSIQTRMGLHIAGYVRRQGRRQPKLRHVFHESWHSAGRFTNENCHTEYHHNGARIPFPSYYSYPVLFNGDNAVANALFNYIPAATGQRIQTDSLSVKECSELAKLVLSVSIQRLAFYVDTRSRRVVRAVGGSIYLAKITEDSFKWIPTSLLQRVKVLFGGTP